jgi:hypothetical protein
MLKIGQYVILQRRLANAPTPYRIEVYRLKIGMSTARKAETR